jgi:hypothetical protein
MSRTLARAMSSTRSITACGPRTSPPITSRLVVAKHSQATRLSGASARKASSTASETRSQTLSGCPSETDSEVKKYSGRSTMRALPSV